MGVYSCALILRGLGMYVLLRVVLCVVPMAALLGVNAWGQTQDDFELMASFAVEDVTNANRTSESELQIDEYQWRPKITASGVLDGRWSRLEVDGDYEVRRFSEQDLQDHELFLGDAMWLLGAPSSRFSAELSYSSRELLVDQLLGDSPENLDRRKIASATGYMRLGQPQSQWLLNVNSSKVAFDVTTVSNSHRQGGGINYDRKVSKVSTFGVELSGYQLDYEYSIDGENTSFDYARAALSWRTTLSKLEYFISSGRNSVGDEVDDTSPFYHVEVEYEGDAHGLSAVFRQWITDTSQGSENTSGQEGGELDGRIDVIDQYKRRDAYIEWTYGGVCIGCSVMMTVGAQREDYRQAIEYDSNELFGVLRLQYKRSRFVSLNADVRYADVAFRDESDDYREHALRLELSLDAVVKGGRLRFYGERRLRESKAGATGFVGGSYNTGLVGVAFDYLLYRR